MNPTLYYTTHASTIGTLILVAGARGLRYVGLLGEGEAASDRLARLFSTPPAPPFCRWMVFLRAPRWRWIVIFARLARA